MMICQVPSVTMNGGSFMRATSQPLAAPIAVPAARPIRIEIGEGMP